ncbi:glycosyltransferase family 4 protein [Devosia sp. A449]
MKVLFISQYFFPEQVSNNNLAKEMMRREHEVAVFTAVPNYPAGKFFEGYSNCKRREDVWNGIRITRARTVPRGSSRFQLLLNYLAFPLAAGVKVLFGKARPDVVFVSQLSPIFMVLPGVLQKWKTGVGLVYWVQDLWPESATFTLGIRNRFVVGLLSTVCGWLYRRADIVLVQSAAFRQKMLGFGVPNDRIRVLPNTAPDSYRPLSSAEAPEYHDLVPQEGFRLMFAGNIGESQDFDTIISAVGLLQHYEHLHVVVVGSGRDEARVRQLVTERALDNRFRFLGRFPEEEMPKLFAHADAMLVSLKDTPIFALTVPYKVQCYLACGKPVVASLNGEGARILVESGAGIAVDAGRPRQLADAIGRMIDEGPEQRNQYAAAARRYFDENYSTKLVYDQLERALVDVATGRS